MHSSRLRYSTMTHEDRVFLIFTVLASIEMAEHMVKAEDLDEEALKQRAERIVTNFEKEKMK